MAEMTGKDPQALQDIEIGLANAEGTLTKNDSHWLLYAADAKRPLCTFPRNISEAAARERARDGLRGFAAGRQVGDAEGRAELQRELRDLLGVS